MLYGCDVSSWQNPGTGKEKDFMIMKASEGKTYQELEAKDHYRAYTGVDFSIPKKDKLYGFYHFARPDNGNHAEDEARNFVSFIAPHVGNCIMALDWEGVALRYTTSWARKWLDTVYELTGVKPLLYCSASYTDKLSEILAGDYGLWVAHWDVEKPEIGVYPFWAFHQYDNSPYDQDKFNGSREDFRKYCRSNQKLYCPQCGALVK